MTRFLAFINEKGGTGKTTLAVNVAAYLAQAKKQKVLLVDLDTQGHAAKAIGIDSRNATPNIFHLLTEPSMSLDDVTRSTGIPQLWVVPAWKEMAEFPTKVAPRADRETLLRQVVREPAEGRYDVVVFDAPPSLGLVSTNILNAADEVVVPVATTYLSLDGCAEVSETVQRIANDRGLDKLRITRVVPTMYRKTALADEIIETLRQHFPTKVTEPVALNVAIDEAQSHAKTIWEYAPWSRGATMMQRVADSIYNA